MVVWILASFCPFSVEIILRCFNNVEICVLGRPIHDWKMDFHLSQSVKLHSVPMEGLDREAAQHLLALK